MLQKSALNRSGIEASARALALALVLGACGEVAEGTIRPVQRRSPAGRIIETGFEIRAATNSDFWARIGHSTTFYENGQTQSAGEWVNRDPDNASFLSDKIGMWTFWFENGQIESQGQYTVVPRGRVGVESVRTGEWFFYDASGRLDETKSGTYHLGARVDE